VNTPTLRTQDPKLKWGLSVPKYGYVPLDDLQQVARNKDKLAFERLFDHYAPLIKAFCLKNSPGATLIAEEVTQDVMLKIWRKADKFDIKKANLNTWVYTLARNSRIDYFRKNGKHVSNIDPNFIWNDLVDESVNLLASVQTERRQLELKSKMDQLSHDQRQVLNKLYMEGKTQQEAAAELEVPLGTIKSRTRLALQKMSLMMNKG